MNKNIKARLRNVTRKMIHKMLIEDKNSADLDALDTGEIDEPWANNDGWNDKWLDDVSGLMEVMARGAKIEYELRNGRRGSYAISGDTLDDLITDLSDFAGELENCIDALRRN